MRFVGFRRFRIAAYVPRVAHDVVAGTPLAGGGFVFVFFVKEKDTGISVAVGSSEVLVVARDEASPSAGRRRRT